MNSFAFYKHETKFKGLERTNYSVNKKLSGCYISLII